MNRLLVLTLMGVSLVLSSYAQEKDDSPKTFSLKQCIDYALEHGNSVKNAKLDVKSAKAQIGEIRGIGLPQVQAEGQILHYMIVPKAFLPAEVFGGEPGVFIAAPFQPAYMGTAGVSVSQLLFDGSYFVGLKAASTYSELSRKSLNQTKIETAEAVTKAYYSALVNKERLKLLQTNVARLDSLHRETKVMYTNGFVEKIDLSRIEVQLNNLRSELVKVERLVELNLHLLKFQMGMNIYEPIVLSDNLQIGLFNYEELLANEAEYNKRMDYSILQTQRDLTDLDIRNYRIQSLPRLVAIGNYGYNRGSGEFDFFRQEWFNNAYVGLSLQVPIFDGLQKNYRVQQARITRQQADNHIKQMENSINLQVSQAKAGLKNSADALLIQERNLELANEVSQVTKVKYEQGIGSNIELINAEVSLRESQTNYFEALYEALIAKVELEKALGILY
jgi:outer membrane protein